MNIYQDFLALEELQFLTGRKQKKMIIEQLNKMGIPFMKNGNGFPIVRRDYASRTKTKKQESANEHDWIPNVLRTA
ncbi:DUF4224 domain-containing protein [Actinobacillus pleuropneumoniae]|uniref:DUF4224 domain-containing protein n=1 Tax=Actinobacillus pleuropneumoniae TaxID=715 RepID=UPI002E9A2D9F|nr:DUF4224 domain-containing protein [Actinobacillus pleuropneumoniae]